MRSSLTLSLSLFGPSRRRPRQLPYDNAPGRRTALLSGAAAEASEKAGELPYRCITVCGAAGRRDAARRGGAISTAAAKARADQATRRYDLHWQARSPSGAPAFCSRRSTSGPRRPIARCGATRATAPTRAFRAGSPTWGPSRVIPSWPRSLGVVGPQRRRPLGWRHGDAPPASASRRRGCDRACRCSRPKKAARESKLTRSPTPRHTADHVQPRHRKEGVTVKDDRFSGRPGRATRSSLIRCAHEGGDRHRGRSADEPRVRRPAAPSRHPWLERA